MENKEEINMETKEFVGKKADEYIANLGIESAIEKLSMLALKSKQAKQVLDVILKRQQEAIIPQPQPEPIQRKDKKRRPSPGFDIKPATKVSLEPKQRFLNLVDKLGISCDTCFDEGWNPMIDIGWTNGRASINGRRVTFGKDFLGFMRKNILWKEKEEVSMRILKVNRYGVVAEPDVEDFYGKKRQLHNAMLRRKRIDRETRIRKSRFEGTVLLRKDRRGNATGVNICSTTVRGKQVIVPKRFLSELMEKCGVWLFEPLFSKEDSVVVKPVEQVSVPVSRDELDKEAWKVSPYHSIKFDKSNGLSAYIDKSDHHFESEEERHEDAMKKLEKAIDERTRTLMSAGKVSL